MWIFSGGGDVSNCTFAVNTTLTSDLLCEDVNVNPDVTVSTSTYSINATQDVMVNGTLDASSATGNQYFGSLWMPNAGTYIATSETTRIENETASGYCVAVEAGGT